MIEVYTKNRKKLAILQNAFGVKENSKLNALGYLDFDLPINDPKNQYCQYRNLVKWAGVVYRIISDEVSSDGMSIHYTCEHIMGKLIDHVLYGFHVVGNRGVYTNEVIEYVLKDEPDFVLGKCEFNRQFEYGWEQENKLAALFSIAKPFVDPYKWVCDTSVYPYKISLLRLDPNAKPKAYIRDGLNRLSVVKKSDSTNIVTRIYPLGAGEGVNQLNISDINGGKPYLQSPQEYIDRYGLVESVWIDRRYENKESLKEMAQKMLNELQEPYAEYSVDYAQLKGEIDLLPGDTVMIIDEECGIKYKNIVTETNIDYDEVKKSTINIANKPQDIASSVADLADRQRIEMAYSQGATQIYSQSIQENADKETGVVMDFIIPDQMRIINKVLCKVRMDSFRAYSDTTSTTDSEAVTSDFHAQESLTSDYKESVNKSTLNSTAISKTSSSYPATTKSTGSSPNMDKQFTGNEEDNYSHHHHLFWLISHTHSFTLPEHDHSFTLPEHDHKFTIPKHNHSFTIPKHNHSFTIPGHKHDIAPGIYRSGFPKSFTVLVNGIQKAVYNDTMAEIDLTPLLVGDDGKIPRGGWQSVEVRPDDLAYISISLSVQGYVQSRGDATV